MKICTIFFVILISISVSAQNIKRGFKSLEKAEYDKAKESFEKNLQEDSMNVASNFGYALVLADDKSTFFDIIAAYKFVVRIKGRESEFSQEDLDIISEYFMNTEVRKTNRPVKKKIEIAEEAIEARLIKYIREENNLDAVYRVLKLYPDYKYYDNVVHIRNQFEFRKYEKMNTLAAYEEFNTKFPDAAQSDKARKYIYSLALEDAKTKNTVEAFNSYINKYPQSVYVQLAVKLRNASAYTSARQKNTIEAYQYFIEKYPDALEIPEVRKLQHQLLYEKAKRVKTLEAYNEFIRNYPDGAYYLDVFNLKASDLGNLSYKNIGFDSPDLIWARALDYSEQPETATSIAEAKDGGILVGGSTRNNDTSYTDAWIVKLDPQGKMIWNKTIGQGFNDDVLNILVTGDNSVIVVGYTYLSADTSSKMGWMFKLSGEGKKLWNKNLGIMDITSSAIGPNDKIYLAYHIADTIPDHYFVQAFSAIDGKTSWERDYIGLGTFNDIKFTPDEKVFLTGSKWFTFADPKFYLIWDDTLKINSTLKSGVLNAQNCVLVATNPATFTLMGYSITGNKLWHTDETIVDPTYYFSDISLALNGDILILSNTESSSTITKYNLTGKLLSNKSISGNYHFINSLTTSKGEFVYLLQGEDYLVLKFSSPGF